MAAANRTTEREDRQRPIEASSCAILAGGESKRMGFDKARSRLLGESLFERVYRTVAPLFCDIMVSAHSVDYRPVDVHSDSPPRVISDTLPGRGPALGICAALENTMNQWVFALPCDLPMVSADLIHFLAGLRNGHDCVIPVAGGRMQTLCAFYRKSCMEELSSRIIRGSKPKDWSLAGFLNDSDMLNILYVGEDELKKVDPALKSFMDVDTPEDLLYIESILKET